MKKRPIKEEFITGITIVEDDTETKNNNLYQEIDDFEKDLVLLVQASTLKIGTKVFVPGFETATIVECIDKRCGHNCCNLTKEKRKVCVVYDDATQSKYHLQRGL